MVSGAVEFFSRFFLNGRKLCILSLFSHTTFRPFLLGQPASDFPLHRSFGKMRRATECLIIVANVPTFACLLLSRSLRQQEFRGWSAHFGANVFRNLSIFDVLLSKICCSAFACLTGFVVRSGQAMPNLGK
jgi:hypothetical protein